MTAIPRRRGLGVTLLWLVPAFLLLAVGLAFTVVGEVAALLAVGCLAAGTTLLVRGTRAR